MEKMTPKESHGIKRRTFLQKGALAVAALVSFPVLRILESPEAISGIEAALSRPYPETSDNPNLETRNVSDAMLEKTWEKHFEPRKDLMTLEAWKKQGGVGRNIAILANLYYDREKLGKDSFDLFYERFIDKMHQVSDIVNLDFIVLTSTLQISGENMGSLKKQQLDVQVDRLRTGLVPVAEALGVEDLLMRGVAREPDPWLLHLRDKIQNPDPNAPDDVQKGMWPYNLVRFEGQSTTGIMDVEPELRAKAFATAANTEAQDTMRTHFGDVVTSYQQTVEKRSAVEETRKHVEILTEGYIDRFGETLDIFLQTDRGDLAAIGLGDPVDIWQLDNFTQTWVEAVQVMNDGQSILPSLVAHMQQEEQQDPKRFYKNFMSQQLRNPLFLPHLIDYATQNRDQQQAAKLTELQEKMKEYEQQATELRVAFNNTLKAEGPHEYNSDFQVLASAITTKMLSQQAGDFDPRDRNSLYWHIYKTCAIREIASPYVLANDSLFLRGSIDNPYAASSMLSHVDEFANLLIKKGFISKPPEKDVASYIKAIHFFRFSRNQAEYPKVFRQDVDELTRYFETYLVTRSYINPLGIEKLETMTWFNPLVNLLHEKGILKKSPREDLARFYKVAEDLLQKRFNLYPELNEENKKKLEDYIAGWVISAAPYDGEQRSLRFVEYPPLVRAQGVVGNSLIWK